MLDAYITEMKTTAYHGQFLRAFRNLLRVHTDIMSLLQLCVQQDSTIRAQVLADPTAVKQLVMLLSITYQGILTFIDLE